ncbi:MAG: NlpC/P60 family protein [Verrucomicrobiota bacterium]
MTSLRNEAHRLSQSGLRYIFGADHPDEGGMDCSGTVQYVLEKLGVDDVPRTSYNQYYWLKRKKLLDDVHGRRAEKKLFQKLSPGDLIFWGGTWKSGHKVSHVMFYLGYDPQTDTHWMFGAQGKRSKGEFGNGVDIFEMDLDRGGRLIAHGKIPGLVYE